MHINIVRNRETQKAVNNLKKSIRQKGATKKFSFLILAGLALFVYGNGLTFADFSGCSMLAMLCWGAAVVYLDAFYPKTTTDPRLMAKSYNEANASVDFKIEINDEYIANEAGNYYTRIHWGAFHAFKLYKKSLILYAGHSYDLMLIIRQDELTKDEFEEFYTFLQNKTTELK